MIWFSKKHDKIKVELVETGKDKPFAVSLVPIEQLPETLAVATILDIGDKKWSVVDATPKHKTEFEKTGKLRIVLTPQQMVDPKDILFSLPTINDRMCVLRKTNSLEGMLVIHEDDWRQVEFISNRLLGDIAAEINSIKAIHATSRQGSGFNKLHVRKLIEEPIDSNVVRCSELKKIFNISKEFTGFGIANPMTVAEHGFAFETTDGLQFYGVLNQESDIVFFVFGE